MAQSINYAAQQHNIEMYTQHPASNQKPKIIVSNESKKSIRRGKQASGLVQPKEIANSALNSNANQLRFRRQYIPQEGSANPRSDSMGSHNRITSDVIKNASIKSGRRERGTMNSTTLRNAQAADAGIAAHSINKIMFKNLPGSPTHDSVVTNLQQIQKGGGSRVYFNSNNSKLKNSNQPQNNYSKIYAGAQSINSNNMPTSSRSNRNGAIMQQSQNVNQLKNVASRNSRQHIVGSQKVPTPKNNFNNGHTRTK